MRKTEKSKREGRPALSVRMDRKSLSRLFRVSKKLERPDASALVREIVEAIVNGDTAERRRVLGDIASRLDALEAKTGAQMALGAPEMLVRGQEAYQV